MKAVAADEPRPVVRTVRTGLGRGLAATRRASGATWRSLAIGAGALWIAAASPAADFPQRKAGLWEVRSAGAEASGLPPSLHCVGEFADSANAHLDRQVGTKGSCTMGAFERVGEAWVAQSVCKEGRTVVNSKAIASGDFETEYRIDTVVSHDTPGPGARREDKEAVVARLIGPCPAGQRPGDMYIPGMGTLNMVDGTFRAAPPTRRRATTPAPRAGKPVAPSAVAPSNP